MIGFEAIKLELSKNFHEQKLHHGILICGKKGVGKASFTQQFCLEILGSRASFNSDVKIVVKAADKKLISVDDIRNCHDFLYQSAGFSQFKFLIIDTACEMTEQASNALLKNLEEPKQNCFLILIANNLNKVIPTIRSRCMIFRVPELSNEQFFEVLTNKNYDFAESDCGFLAELCDHAPGIAIEQGKDLTDFYRLFLNIIATRQINEALIQKITNKSFSFAVFERVQSIFFSRLLNFLANQKFSDQRQNFMNQFCWFADEKIAFERLGNTHSTEFLLDLAEESFKRTKTAIHLFCDKKTNIINNLSRLTAI